MRRHPRAELDDQNREHQHRRRCRTPSAARGTPAAAIRTARRFRRCSRPAASASAARVRISATALPRSRPSRRPLTQRHAAQVLAQQLRLAVRRASGAPRATPASSSPSPRADQRLRQPRRIEPERVRQAHAHRHAAIEQPQIGGTSPSHAAASCVAHLSTVSPSARRWRPDRSSHVTSGLPRCMPTTSTTPSIFSSISSTGSASVSSTLGVVAEDLHLDRRRAALEVAEHVLQQLDELDLGQRRRLLQLRPHVGDDLLRRSRSRSPRGFSRTRMSPVFCAVANSPSSDPVRREYAATSGVVGDHLLHRADLAVGLAQRAAGRRQVVDDEAAFVGRRQKSGADRRRTGRRSPPASDQRPRDRDDRTRDHHVEPARCRRAPSTSCVRSSARRVG